MRRNASIECGVALAALLALGLWAPTAYAQAAAAADSAATLRVTSPTRKPAVAKASSVARRTKSASTTKKAPTPTITAKAGVTRPEGGVAAAKAPRDSVKAPRTLDDVNIQGEIPVPQVLFITARDQRRFLDFQHRRYLKNSQRVGETTVLPSWIAVTPDTQRQESPR